MWSKRTRRFWNSGSAEAERDRRGRNLRMYTMEILVAALFLILLYRLWDLQIVQGEPYSSLEGQVKLSLPIGTGIRKNDIVQSRETGLRYRADVPREIRGHHIIVTLRREGGVKGAI